MHDTLQWQIETILHSLLWMSIESCNDLKRAHYIIPDRTSTKWEWKFNQAAILCLTITILESAKVDYFQFSKRQQIWLSLNSQSSDSIAWNNVITFLISNHRKQPEWNVNWQTRTMCEKSELACSNHKGLIIAVLLGWFIHFWIHGLGQNRSEKKVMDCDGSIKVLIGILYCFGIANVP
jgi:hypothetical protein